MTGVAITGPAPSDRPEEVIAKTSKEYSTPLRSPVMLMEASSDSTSRELPALVTWTMKRSAWTYPGSAEGDVLGEGDAEGDTDALAEGEADAVGSSLGTGDADSEADSEGAGSSGGDTDGEGSGASSLNSGLVVSSAVGVGSKASTPDLGDRGSTVVAVGDGTSEALVSELVPADSLAPLKPSRHVSVTSFVPGEAVSSTGVAGHPSASTAVDDGSSEGSEDAGVADDVGSGDAAGFGAAVGAGSGSSDSADDSVGVLLTVALRAEGVGVALEESSSGVDGDELGDVEAFADGVDAGVGEGLCEADGLGEADSLTVGVADGVGDAVGLGVIDGLGVEVILGEGDGRDATLRELRTALTSHSGGNSFTETSLPCSSIALGGFADSAACALGNEREEKETPIAVTATNTERMPGLPSVPSRS